MKRALFLHGAGGGPWQWEAWRRIWGETFEVHAPQIECPQMDLSEIGLEDYAEYVRKTSDRIRPDVVVGASMGGLLALHVVAANTVLINPVPWWGTGKAVTENDVREWSKGSVRSSLAKDLSFAVSVYSAARWRDESGRVLRQLAAGVGGKPQSSRDAHCLVVASRYDEEIPFSAMRTMAAKMDADLWTIPEASHLGPVTGASAGETALRAMRWTCALIRSGSIHSGCID